VFLSFVALETLKEQIEPCKLKMTSLSRTKKIEPFLSVTEQAEQAERHRTMQWAKQETILGRAH
jgi:hypothetical protein